MTEHSNGVTTYIKGGLGNQLFMLAAGWEQSARLGCPLYLDTSDSVIRGGPEYELGTMNHPGTVSNGPWTAVRISTSKVVPVPRLVKPYRRRVFVEKDRDRYDSRIHEIQTGTTLFGYFHSPRYFETVASSMRSVLENVSLSEEEGRIIDTFTKDKRISVHLRRGDYLNSSTNQILASPAYARRGINLLRDLGIDGGLRIFTDSPDRVRTELSDWNDDLEIVGPEAGLSSMATIIAMSRGSGIVTSNSSFSWWAAWLLDGTENTKHNIICPRPWFSRGTARADMLDRNWITLDAR